MSIEKASGGVDVFGNLGSGFDGGSGTSFFSPPPLPTPPSLLPACIGNQRSWSTAFGGCDIYLLEHNKVYCYIDTFEYMMAYRVCPQCDLCQPASSPPPVPTSPPPVPLVPPSPVPTEPPPSEPLSPRLSPFLPLEPFPPPSQPSPRTSDMDDEVKDTEYVWITATVSSIVVVVLVTSVFVFRRRMRRRRSVVSESRTRNTRNRRRRRFRR